MANKVIFTGQCWLTAKINFVNLVANNSSLRKINYALTVTWLKG